MQTASREEVRDASFDATYSAFIESHIIRRSGNAQERIASGLGHAELEFLKNVWWPCFHHFDRLHPEYEMQDFTDSNRYIDFAYLHPQFRIAIEIDGFGPHWKDLTQDQFVVDRQRQNHLVIDDWRVLRFAYKSVSQQPRLCQQTIQQLLGKLSGITTGQLAALKPADRAIVQLALGQNRPITAQDIMKQIRLSRSSTARHLQDLTNRKWLEPADQLQRTHAYRLHPIHAITWI